MEDTYVPDSTVLDDLRKKFPRLITCDISGYGDSGDYQKMKAYDFLVQCETGLVSISGSPDASGRVGVSVCDIGAGMNALIGINKPYLHDKRVAWDLASRSPCSIPWLIG